MIDVRLQGDFHPDTRSHIGARTDRGSEERRSRSVGLVVRGSWSGLGAKADTCSEYSVDTDVLISSRILPCQNIANQFHTRSACFYFTQLISCIEMEIWFGQVRLGYDFDRRRLESKKSICASVTRHEAYSVASCLILSTYLEPRALDDA